jgi:hypothetical protein
MAQDDDWFRQSEAELETNTRRGLRILAFYIIPAAVLLWLTWSFVKALFAPAIVAGVIAYFVWRFRDTPAVEWLRDRVLEAWSWIRSLLARKPRVIAQTPNGDAVVDGAFSVLPSVAWESPAQDDEHAWYRQEYLRTHEMLAHQSRAPGDQMRRALLLHNAEMHDALVIRGDRVPLQTIAPEPARQPRIAGLLSGLSHIHVWAIGAIAAFAGLQYVRAEHNDNRADRAEQNMEALRIEAEQSRMEADASQRDLAVAITAHDADRVRWAQTEAAQAEALRRQTRRNQALAQRELERRNEIATRNPGAVVDWGDRLRQLESVTAPDADNLSRDGAAAGSDNQR